MAALPARMYLLCLPRHFEMSVQLREALGLMEERWGKTAPQLVVPCTELAQLLLASQRRDEARAMCERAASVATRLTCDSGVA